MNFTAKYLHIDDTPELVTVGLADDQFETKKYVLFQRVVRPTDQDRKLGHHAPHYEINNPLLSGYGGVSHIQLVGKQLFIKFDPPLIGVGSSLTVNLEMLEGVNELCNLLTKIFGDCFKKE